MKELTIEEKANAYDKIREKIAIRFGSNVADEIFSEHEDNKDERIRKALIRFHKSTIDIDGIKGEDIIAWLEKQDGNTLIKEIKRRKELYSQEKEKAVSSTERLSLVGRIAMLEELCAFIDVKQGEQKPADNVEPKFHEGDWITNGAANPAQITSIKDGIYFTHDDTIGGDIESMDKEYHLWTIQDARDGDVLQLGTVTAIFKKYIGQEKCICYCSIDEDGVFEIPIEDRENNIYGCTNTTPATKEQRDTLFGKMHEAGYEWDAEKKELKHIDARENLTLDGDLMQADCMIVEQKHAWSEEDERICSSIIYDIANNKAICMYQLAKDICDKQINWLKSLKQRIKG